MKRKTVQKYLRILCMIPVITALCVICVSALGELPPKNSQPRHQVCTALSESARAYYTGEYRYEKLSVLPGAEDISTSLFAMRDNELFSALHDLMTDTHAYRTSYSGYQKGSLAYFWPYTDAVESSGSYVMFYSDVMMGDGVTMNREHIWPKSRASFHQKNGGADLHHLRPSVGAVNNAKSDHAFGYISGTYTQGYKEGVVNGSVVYWAFPKEDLFECKDDVKGDVARILLYVYCRWEQPNLYSSVSEGLPAFDSDDTADSGKKVIESLDTLLQWCENDPVDTWEMERNDLVEEIQGNRNVFIDYPELAWQMFSQELPTGMSTPTHTGCEHCYEEVARNEAGCVTDGSFTLKCSKCGSEYQRRLPSLGGHTDENSDGICDRCGWSKQEDILLGDTDGDKAVSVLDATAIQKRLANLPNRVFVAEAADTDEDGFITVLDATMIQKWLANLPSNDKIGKQIIR